MATMMCSEDQFLCSICLEVFTDPVTTACGHSFCNICINRHWDNCVHCHCPVCKEEFSSRPQLKTSTFMLEMVSEFKNKPQREDSEASESGDVPCDVCPEPKLKALKSCLVCQTSYCPDHLRPHNTVVRLKKHQLIGPVENLEERICAEHGRPMELYCRDHSQLICVQCLSDHKGHNTVPLKEQCEEEQSELQQKIQERRRKIHELQRSVELSQENANREKKEGEMFFSDLMKCVQQSLCQFKESINKKHQEVKEKVEGFIKELESEVSVLEPRQEQMEDIFSSEDHFHFVQTFVVDQPAPELKDWTWVSVRAPSFEGRLAVAVSDLWLNKINPKIEEFFKSEMKRAKKHEVNVTLDPDTAHANLVVSPKQVRINGGKNDWNTSRGFSNWYYYYVSGKQKFTSGRFYYEVQVKGNTFWCLGVVKESADRKGASNEQNGFWKTGYEKLPMLSCPEMVGVFVDYEEGLVCFFDAETSVLIKCFTDCCFADRIMPLFSPGRVWCCEDSAPLIITPVTVGGLKD